MAPASSRTAGSATAAAAAAPRVLAERRAVREGRGEHLGRVRRVLPAAATLRGRSSPGRSFRATGVSLVLHPRNPYVPTTHANFRFLAPRRAPAVVRRRRRPDALLPVRRGRGALPPRPAARPATATTRRYYPRFKAWCDEYFFLPHRGETRGVGGLFFDYLQRAMLSTRSSRSGASVGDAFLPAYLPIVERRSADALRRARARSSSSTGAAATSSSTCSTTAAPCSASRPTGASSRS